MRRLGTKEKYASVKINNGTHGLRRLLPCEIAQWHTRIDAIVRTGSEHGRRLPNIFNDVDSGACNRNDGQRLRTLLRVGH